MGIFNLGLKFLRNEVILKVDNNFIKSIRQDKSMEEKIRKFFKYLFKNRINFYGLVVFLVFLTSIIITELYSPKTIIKEDILFSIFQTVAVIFASLLALLGILETYRMSSIANVVLSYLDRLDKGYSTMLLTMIYGLENINITWENLEKQLIGGRSGGETELVKSALKRIRRIKNTTKRFIWITISLIALCLILLPIVHIISKDYYYALFISISIIFLSLCSLMNASELIKILLFETKE